MRLLFLSGSALALLAFACSSADTPSVEEQLSAASGKNARFTTALPIPPVLEPQAREAGVTQYHLHAEAGGTHYFDAKRHGATYAYNGGVKTEVRDDGGKVAVTSAANGSTLGPTLRVRRGDRLDVQLHGKIDKMTSLHWHGLKVGADADVFPRHGVGPMSGMDGMASASFQVAQEAATLWYHPHVHMDVGRQQYLGLAGLMIIDDENSQALAQQGMPSEYGVDDIPIILQDYRFKPNGELTYVVDEQDQDGMLGDQISINGVLRPVFTAKRSLTRFRILNASTSRAYKIGFSNHQRFWQIATDGGFLDKPVETSIVSVAPAERVEIVVDLAAARTGMIQLVSNSFEPLDRHEAMEVEEGKEDSLDWREGPKHRSRRSKDDLENVKAGRPPAGYGFALAQIRIPTGLTQSRALPQVLNHMPPLDASRAVNLANPRVFRLEGPATDDPHNTDHFDYAATINKQKMDPEMVRVDERVRQGTLEVWDIRNDAPDMMHPFHVHAGQFRVLSRSSGPLNASDMGWKDTVQTFPGESVKILVDFSVPRGQYFYHCHILEHEDMGMMGLLSVE